ncbi:glycine oxidase ThiO [Sporosarcina sp. FSL K6-1522]|uniref:glycine oxidase ThiO n=1 Tax=Sporosarcina sp. FSL K6-1522 TaxID=2921554 RepID=UPI00315B3CE1
MSHHVDVAIIGGGIIGCSIAYYLAKAGLTVGLVERDNLAQGTTQAAGGMLGAHSEYINDGFYAFARESQTLYKTFQQEIGIDIGYTTGGILQFAYTEEELLAGARWNDATYLTSEEFHNQLPHIASPARGAYLFTEDVHVHPQKTALAFCQAAQQLGATVSTGIYIDDIKATGEGYQVAHLLAKHVVIAGGSASTELIPGLQMSAVKGQCMQLDARDRQLPYTLCHQGRYVIPRPDGTLVIGATMEPDVLDVDTTTSGNVALHDIAERFIPGLSQFPVLKRWAGLRPKTVDELPYIGRVPGQENMHVAAGHFRNGILLAPATACLIRDLIVGQTVPTERLEAFNPKRGIFHEENHRVERQFV